MTMPLSLHHEYMGLVLQVRLLLRQKRDELQQAAAMQGLRLIPTERPTQEVHLTVRAYRAVCAVRKLKQRSQPGPNG